MIAWYKFNERKWLYFGKGKKQKMPRTNDYGRGQRWWHSASGQYTCPGRMPAGTNGRWHMPPCQHRPNDIDALELKSRHLHTKWKIFETCGQVHLARNQRLIYKNDINTWLVKAWTAIDRLSVIWKTDQSDKIKRSFFSRKQSCQYCCRDAPHGSWLSVQKESLTATTQ